MGEGDTSRRARIDGSEWVCVCGVRKPLDWDEEFQNCTDCHRNRDFVLRNGPHAAEDEGEDQAGAHSTCPHCGGEVDPQYPKCRHCGEWIGRPSTGSQLSVTGKGLFLAALFLVVLCWSVPALHYGTLSPCEMVRKEIMRKGIAENAAALGASDSWEAAGSAIGLALGERVVDSFVSSLSTTECISGLVKLHAGGDLSGL